MRVSGWRKKLTQEAAVVVGMHTQEADRLMAILGRWCEVVDGYNSSPRTAALYKTIQWVYILCYTPRPQAKARRDYLSQLSLPDLVALVCDLWQKGMKSLPSLRLCSIEIALDEAMKASPMPGMVSAQHPLPEVTFGLVVHELRSPLASLRGYVQLLERQARRGSLFRSDEDASLVLGHMARILAQTERMTRLIDDLVDLARGRAGKWDLRVERVDLRALLEDLVADYRIGYQGRAIEICTPGVPVWVYADAARLRQVIGNLFVNAHHHTPIIGKILIGVVPGPGQGVVFVHDEGPGVAHHMQERIFDQFFQAGSHQAGGLGLGLAIARSIVEAHGGRIGVESAPGEGATFWFAVPLIAGSEYEHEQTDSSVGSDGRPPQGSPEREPALYANG